MRFTILSISTQSAYILPKGHTTFHVFTFGQVNCPGDFATNTEVVLEYDDPRVKAWFEAHREQKFFEFSMDILE